MIGVASDHGGYEVKEKLINYLKELNYDIKDYGTNNIDSVDYPLFAFKVSEDIVNGNLKFGILVCTTGIGMSIAANKVKGIRCAKVDNFEEAYLARSHNDSNILAISAMKDFEEIKKIVKVYLETSFSNEQRHINRIKEITDYEC